MGPQAKAYLRKGDAGGAARTAGGGSWYIESLGMLDTPPQWPSGQRQGGQVVHPDISKV